MVDAEDPGARRQWRTQRTKVDVEGFKVEGSCRGLEVGTEQWPGSTTTEVVFVPQVGTRSESLDPRRSRRPMLRGRWGGATARPQLPAEDMGRGWQRKENNRADAVKDEYIDEKTQDNALVQVKTTTESFRPTCLRRG